MPKQYWIGRYKDTAEYVAVDAASGGYPYRTEWLTSARIWADKEEAIRYLKVCNLQSEVQLYELVDAYSLKGMFNV